MIKKQQILIIVLALLFVALIVGYFAIVRPMVNAVEPEVTTEPLETVAGEVVGHGDRYLMFAHTEKEDIRSIEVHNEHGTYTFYRDADGNFQIKGHEGITYDQELFSYLVVSSGYTLSMTKVEKPISMEEYGVVRLTNEDGSVWEPAWFKLTTVKGVEHTVYIGYKLVTGGGYYARYAGRDEIYVLNTDLEKTILAPIEDLVTPMVTFPMTMNSYFMVTNFALLEGEEVKMMIDYVPEEERAGEYANRIYRMTGREEYMVSSTNYDAVLQAFYSATPLRCVKLGLTDEALAEYGLDNPPFYIQYVYPSPDVGNVENIIVISARNENGNYYVASPIFDQIVEITGSDFDFLTWDFIDWVDDAIFQRNIDYVREIRVESPAFNETFILEGLGKELVVTQKSNGRKPDVSNFRQFYKTLLTASYEGDMPMNAEEMAALTANDANLQLKLTIITDSTTLEYKFYPYTERRSYITVNGNGEFYILRSMADKIIADADRVTRDEPVNSDAKY